PRLLSACTASAACRACGCQPGEVTLDLGDLRPELRQARGGAETRQSIQGLFGQACLLGNRSVAQVVRKLTAPDNIVARRGDGWLLEVPVGRDQPGGAGERDTLKIAGERPLERAADAQFRYLLEEDLHAAGDDAARAVVARRDALEIVGRV